MAKFTSTWKGMDEIKKKLNPSLFLVDVEEAVKDEAKFAQQELIKLTPRDKDSDGPHIADMWEEPVRQDDGGRVVYYIGHPCNMPGFIHKGRIMNNGTNFNLLLALEYGTLRHVIPVKPGGTSFKKKDGTWVRLMRDIEHPGTDDYAMMRKTK